MLRCYTPSRADAAAIDEMLAVEELVFPFAGAEVLPLREVHVCRVGIGLCDHPLHLAIVGTFESERGRRRSVSPVQPTDLGAASGVSGASQETSVWRDTFDWSAIKLECSRTRPVLLSHKTVSHTAI